MVMTTENLITVHVGNCQRAVLNHHGKTGGHADRSHVSGSLENLLIGI